jgi:hypothetical protein
MPVGIDGHAASKFAQELGNRRFFARVGLVFLRPIRALALAIIKKRRIVGSVIRLARDVLVD